MCKTKIFYLSRIVCRLTEIYGCMRRSIWKLSSAICWKKNNFGSHTNPEEKNWSEKPIWGKGGQNPRHWNFQDATKNCGFTIICLSWEPQSTLEYLELGLFLQNWPSALCFNFWLCAQRKTARKRSKKCNFSNLAYYSSKSFQPFWGVVGVKKRSPFFDSW